MWSDHEMVHDIIPGAITPLPQPPAGWFDYGYAVLWNGDLALLRTNFDIHAALTRWQNEAAQGGISGAWPDFTEARLRLSTFDGAAESPAIEVPAGHWPKVNRLPDGRWLVVADLPKLSHDLNARLYAADGTAAGAFAMGNYIAHVQCAIDGTIWAGYIDQGVLAGAISSAGIARFDADGQVIWRFNDDAGRDLYVFDCYSLTLDGSTLWSCCYTDFPIVRIAQGGVRHWRNKLSGANALAVDDDHVLLAGGYGEDSSRLALLHLIDGEARLAGRWRFTPPERETAGLMQGHGSTLHIVGGGWRRIEVASLRDNRGRARCRPDRFA